VSDKRKKTEGKGKSLSSQIVNLIHQRRTRDEFPVACGENIINYSIMIPRLLAGGESLKI